MRLFVWLSLALFFLCPASPRADAFEDGALAFAKGDFRAAFQHWRPLAEAGNADAQAMTGALYAEGKGVAQDDVEAAAWLRKAAEQGVAQAQFQYAILCRNGRGALQSDAEAAKWHKRAAEQGVPEAQYHLAFAYEKGQGLPQDFIQAYKWYSLASTSLPASKRELADKAIKNRSLMAAKMSPLNVVEAKKQTKEWQPKFERPH
jgi:TPR repeat protein